MITDAEIRVKGITALTAALGTVEAARFIALLLRDSFDYTRWQQSLFDGQSLPALHLAADRHRRCLTVQSAGNGCDFPLT